MTRGEMGLRKATTVAVTMMCLALGGHAWAGGPGAGETPEDAAGCAAIAKATTAQCKATFKEAKAACKAQTKSHKARCVQKKKDCTSVARSLNRSHGGGASAISVKCSVKNRQCTTATTADTKRCELEAKGDALTCELEKQAAEAICVATVQFPPNDIDARCQARCDANGQASSQHCQNYKPHELKVCEQTKKLEIKRCQASRKLCDDENRVAKLLKKGGVASSIKDCGKRLKQCTSEAKDTLKSCKKEIADNACEPDSVVSCTVKCVQAARPQPKPVADPTPEPKEADAQPDLKTSVDGLPYPAICKRDAVKLYVQVLNQVFALLMKHSKDVEGAVKAIGAYQAAHEEDLACVNASVALWQTLPEERQEALRKALTPMRDILTNLAENAPDLLKDPRVLKALSFK